MRVAAKDGAASVIWDSKRHEQSLPQVADRVCRYPLTPPSDRGVRARERVGDMSVRARERERERERETE